ncbi:hypothetical protein D3C84_943950 [compost metagenome]
MPLEGAGIRAGHANQVNLEVSQFLRQAAFQAVLKRPAVGEHAVDPALEQPWHRPPIHREDQHQGVGPVDAGLFGGYIGRRCYLVAVDGMVREVEPRVETFLGEIADLGAVAGQAQACGDL